MTGEVKVFDFSALQHLATLSAAEHTEPSRAEKDCLVCSPSSSGMKPMENGRLEVPNAELLLQRCRLQGDELEHVPLQRDDFGPLSAEPSEVCSAHNA